MFSAKVLRILNTFNVFCKSVAYTQHFCCFYLLCYAIALNTKVYVDTIEREFGNLRMIKDSHPKYVVSMDRMYGDTNIDGIKHLHLRDFLKKQEL